MEHHEYEVMYHSEEDYWWYVGLRDLILATLADVSRGQGGLTLLDAGCGTGKLLEVCRGYHAFGLEVAPEGLRFSRLRALTNLVQASADRMPFADGSFDLVVSADVLYTIPAPGDQHALREMARVLKRGGHLLLNLPAYEFLRGRHDIAIHTRQRYTRGRLRAMLDVEGFRVRTLTYRNSLLFPVAALVRCLQGRAGAAPARPKSDLRRLPGPLNRALTWPLLLENRLIRSGARFPFGLSVYCVATKP